MGYHDNCLPLLAVEGLKQIQNLISCLTVQVACGLVTEEQGGVRHDGSGDADPLLLATRKSAGIMPGPVGQPNSLLLKMS